MSWFRRLFGIAEPTIVYLRSTKPPAEHWERRVHYDAWGAPYIPYSHFGNGPVSSCEIVLRPDGKTSNTYLYGTEWRHKSGPPVTFGNTPKTPFN